MSRFDRYLLSQLMMVFGFFALILVAVYWVNRAVVLFDQLIADGQSAWVFLQLTALTLPNVIRLVLPVAAFVAALYVTNRLSSESELVVMQATGFSPWRLARPVLYFGLLVMAMMAVLMHVLVPLSRAELHERQNQIAENVTSKFLNAGVFMHPGDGVTLYIREITPLGELRDVFLVDARDPRNETTYTAERALVVRAETGPKLVMFSGLAQNRDQHRRLSATRFADFTYDVGALIAGGRGRGLNLQELPTAVLLAAEEATVAAARSTRALFLSEAHERLSQPLLALVAPLIGFSCLLAGGFSRFGLWRQIALAVAVLALVQFLGNGLTNVARGDARGWPLMYVAPLAGLAASAAVLAYGTRTRRSRPPRGLEVPA